MDSAAKIVEISLMGGGNVLVTFADGMMARLEPEQIRQVAVDANTLKRPPPGAFPSG